MTDKRKIIITSSLPYANGPIHLGHLVEYIQTDIWKRYQNLMGNDCYYICGSDSHGTPIMLYAEKQGITPEQLIAQVREQHITDFSRFHVEFDHFSSTHTDTNRELTESIYNTLKANNHISVKTIEQLFDPEKNMFLPDRFVKGECPRCGKKDQYGDGCESCGATYSPMDLKNPTSAVSGATPITKESEHYFFELPQFTEQLKTWMQSGSLQSEINNKLNEWFESGLQAWDISRDKPYFGFLIPGTTDKYFYVWVDAPIGYMAAFKEFCADTGLDFDEFWKADSTTELYHFIGKDVMYFHSLFWPAMLMGSHHRTPSAVFVHGMLTVNGEKMSKSRGTFVKAETYAKHLNPECLRYYYAAKLSNQITDIDLSMDDFRLRVNSDLVGKVVNIASRCASFITKKFDSKLATQCDNNDLHADFVNAGTSIAALYEQREYSKAMREIMALADKANQYIDEFKPWQLIKEEGKAEQVHQVCSLALNLFRVLMTYLKPILPEMATKVEAFLNVDLTWQGRKTYLVDHAINKFKPLLQRVEEEDIQKMLEDSQEDLISSTPATGPLADNPIADEITIDDFTKVDLRIAKIVNAEHVEEAKKLLKLELDIGGETRQVFSGIKSSYNPEDLIGKLTVMVANLKPRKMRFGMSEGMVLAAATESGIYLLEPHDGAVPGLRVT